MAFIKLTRGKLAEVDDADVPLVERYAWRALRGTGKSRIFWYAVAWGDEGHAKLLMLHRLLLGLKPSDPDVDHRDRDGLNNRRSNLRLATGTQNNANSNGSPTRRKSRFKGVVWDKQPNGKVGGYWRAAIRINGKHISRYARTEIEAARAYNDLALQHFGEFARLNVVDGA